jgi:hypothetical protein
MTTIFALLVLFQFKHFIADYPLQTKYMLGKFRTSDWVWPLAAHCGVHAGLTAMIAWFVSGNIVLVLGLGLFDFLAHFVMDRIKADPALLGRFKSLNSNQFSEYSRIDEFGSVARSKLRSNKLFWWSLGFDQMVHHLTNYFVIWCLVQ